MSPVRTFVAGILALAIDHADAQPDRCATIDRSPPPEDIAPVCEGFDATSAQGVVDHPKAPSVRAYVTGLIDMMFLYPPTSQTIDGVSWRIYALEWAGPHKACLAGRVPITLETIVNPVAAYLLKHPDWGSGPFIGALPYALSEAYTCPASLR
jgi:hypothetical protein